MRVMKIVWNVIAVLAVLAVVAGIVGYVLVRNEGRVIREDFDRRRQNWTARCEVYVGRWPDTADARQCQADLLALLAEARRNGW